MSSELMGDDATTRSGLFFDAIRLIKEMRKADEEQRTGRPDQLVQSDGDGRPWVRPRYTIYENVPGALSSHEGKDWQAVLTESIRVIEPEAPLFLYLKGDGQQREWHMGTDGPLPTAFMMRNTSEFHKGGNGYPLLWTTKGTLPVRSCLTSILESNADPKYNLSAKACQGILNRAERRGKELPEILKKALLRQASDGSVGGERIGGES